MTTTTTPPQIIYQLYHDYDDVGVFSSPSAAAAYLRRNHPELLELNIERVGFYLVPKYLDSGTRDAGSPQSSPDSAKELQALFDALGVAS